MRMTPELWLGTDVAEVDVDYAWGIYNKYRSSQDSVGEMSCYHGEDLERWFDQTLKGGAEYYSPERDVLDPWIRSKITRVFLHCLLDDTDIRMDVKIPSLDHLPKNSIDARLERMKRFSMKLLRPTRPKKGYISKYVEGISGKNNRWSLKARGVDINNHKLVAEIYSSEKLQDLHKMVANIVTYDPSSELPF